MVSKAKDERLTSCGDWLGGVNSCIERLRRCDESCNGRNFSCDERLPASKPSL